MLFDDVLQESVLQIEQKSKTIILQYTSGTQPLMTSTIFLSETFIIF